MKNSYLLGAILVCGVIGAMVPTRTVKTILLVIVAVLSGYGLARALGLA
jgi:hypothetical protein